MRNYDEFVKGLTTLELENALNDIAERRMPVGGRPDDWYREAYHERTGEWFTSREKEYIEAKERSLPDTIDFQGRAYQLIETRFVHGYSRISDGSVFAVYIETDSLETFLFVKANYSSYTILETSKEHDLQELIDMREKHLKYISLC